MGSDQDIGRKMAEEEELLYFLDAYARATGKKMKVISASERPDFVCRIDNGNPFGIELTKIMRSPDVASWEKNVEFQDFRDPANAYHAALEAANEKSRKMKSGGWQFAERTILVLQDMDCPLKQLYREFRRRPSFDEFRYLGFLEIWIADYSELDAYYDVELMGVFPRRIRRYYKSERGKPYG